MSSPFVIGTLAVLLFLTSLFMILLVLIQRGRGGGLAGAFGGQGGQSAFGTRAGDVFTKITVVVAIVFILLASLLGKGMRSHQAELDSGEAGQFDSSVETPSEDPELDDYAAPPLKAGDGNDDSSASTPDFGLPPAEDTGTEAVETVPNEESATQAENTDSAESTDDTPAVEAEEPVESETPESSTTDSDTE